MFKQVILLNIQIQNNQRNTKQLSKKYLYHSQKTSVSPKPKQS